MIEIFVRGAGTQSMRGGGNANLSYRLSLVILNELEVEDARVGVLNDVVELLRREVDRRDRLLISVVVNL